MLDLNVITQLVFLSIMFSLLQFPLWQKIQEWDQWLFIKLNSGLSNPVFDAIMPFLRHGNSWAPLYLFFAVFVLLNYRGKGWWWIVFFIATVALTDMIGTYAFKHNFYRPRPCADLDFSYRVHFLLDQCSGSSSFISNHAANHFGMATFLFVTFSHVTKKWLWLAFVWASLIAFAQIYVGVHYPLDVLAGALLGIMIGSLSGKLFNKRFGFSIFDNKPTMSS